MPRAKVSSLLKPPRLPAKATSREATAHSLLRWRKSTRTGDLSGLDYTPSCRFMSEESWFHLSSLQLFPGT